MGIEVKKVDNGLGTLIIGNGEITSEEFISTHMNKIFIEDILKDRIYSFSDYTNVENVNINPQDIKIISSLIAKNKHFFNKKGLFVVVGKEDITYGFSRMWQSYTEDIIEELNWEVKVFRKIKEAEKWIKDKIKQEYDIDIMLS